MPPNDVVGTASLWEWLYQFFKLKDDALTEQIITLLWAIWSRRNKWVFEQVKLSPEQTWRLASSVRVVMATDAGPRQNVARAGNERARMAAWKPPPAGVVKVNTDVSLSGSGECGMGLVARDYRGRVLASAAARQFHSLTIAVAEGIAVKWAIRLALDLGFKDVVFETDNMQVVSAWSTFSSNFSYLASVVSDCVALSSSFSSFSLSHVCRGANKAADFMAKYALSGQCFVWIGDAPHALEGILSMDVAAISS